MHGLCFCLSYVNRSGIIRRTVKLYYLLKKMFMVELSFGIEARALYLNLERDIN